MVYLVFGLKARVLADREECALDDSDERALEVAMRKMSLSARAHDRILKGRGRRRIWTVRHALRPDMLPKPCNIEVSLAITAPNGPEAPEAGGY